MLDYDVVIIGSGIAGMTCAIYLKRSGIKTLIIEKNAPGGQLNRSSVIENYPGYVSIEGPTLASNIYDQVRTLKVDYLYDFVTKIDNEKKEIITNNKTIKYKYIVVATGREPRKLNLEDEDKLIGNGISYCALCDGRLYKDEDVVVVGGSNSAIEEAIYLAKICNKVTIVIRKDKFTAEKKLLDELDNNKNIEIIKGCNIIKYNIKDNKLVSIELDNNKKINLDGLFISIGYIPITNFIDVDKDNDYIVVNDNYETSINNIYACGDTIKKDTYQLTTAVGEATIVSHNIMKKLVINNN